MSSTALVPAKSASTPVKKKPQITDSPGNWKHPRLDDITKRQAASEFSETNIRTIVYNILAFAVLLVVRLLRVKFPWLPKAIGEDFIAQYSLLSWLLHWTIWLIPFVNIVVALLPLFRKKDQLLDIPLTPGQRKLLGLGPNSVPATPNSVYSTPPRYSRTPSISGSIASNKSYTSSPLSRRGSPAPLGRLSGSPAGSPLLQKAMTGAVNGVRRSSFGSPSPLGASSGTSLFPDLSATPSPAAGKRSSVGLNNKWLYERGRRSSGGGSWLR